MSFTTLPDTPSSLSVPVSRPVLTLKAPQDQTVVGDVVELHCEALGDSPVILYRFYHENITLEKSPGLSGRGVSFNLSLTAEHSGNYSCEVDNGHEVQRSEAVTLNVKGTALIVELSWSMFPSQIPDSGSVIPHCFRSCAIKDSWWCCHAG